MHVEGAEGEHEPFSVGEEMLGCVWRFGGGEGVEGGREREGGRVRERVGLTYKVQVSRSWL